jgi:AraC-like DNA-binding protein
MRIRRSEERFVVLGPGVPDGRCLVELADRCGYRVCQICHELGCSPAHFRNVFVRDTGWPPKRWLADVRVRRAREQLEAGAATGEIALRLGFSCHASLRRSLARQLPELFEGEGRKFG